MAVQQKFIPDPPNTSMTPDQKNGNLSAKLIQAPYLYLKIVRIERDDQSMGWLIHYQQ